MSLLDTVDLQRIFESLDQNGDGRLSIEELKWLLESVGAEADYDDLELVMGKVDGHSHGLSFEEFSYLYDSMVEASRRGRGRRRSTELAPGAGNYYHHNGPIDEEEDDEEEESYLLDAFKVFDMNGDGFISPEEIKEVLCKLGMWNFDGGFDCATIVRAYDTNSDGLVDFQEFKQMMMHARHQIMIP